MNDLTQIQLLARSVATHQEQSQAMMRVRTWILFKIGAESIIPADAKQVFEATPANVQWKCQCNVLTSELDPYVAKAVKGGPTPEPQTAE